MPKRGIRALLLAEMTGSIAYLANNEERIRDFVCALNVDMAGENQTLCGSTLMIETPPDACRGFSTELAREILNRVFKKENLLGKTGGVMEERISVQPFAGGSDHVNFSDPDVGVPCPSLCQWPDKYYHTSADTPDKVDPQMLAATASLSACYAAFISSASEREAKWLGLEMLTGLKQSTEKDVMQRLTAAIERGSSSGEELSPLRKKLSYRLERTKDSFEHLGRLGLPAADIKELKEEANEWVRKEFARAEENYVDLLSHPKGPAEGPSRGGKKLKEEVAGEEVTRGGAELESIVPERVIRGPSGFGMVTRDPLG